MTHPGSLASQIVGTDNGTRPMDISIMKGGDEMVEIDTQIARVKDLIARREEIDAELAGIFGVVPKARKTMRCSTCNEEGHTTRTCPQKPSE
jgi:hypothetical protein